MKFCHCMMAVFVLFSIFGCASTKQIENSTVAPVYITNTKKFYLMSPAEIENKIDALQLLNGKFGENEFVMQALLQADEKGIFLSLFNDFGVGMGNLTYDGITANFDSKIFPNNLKAEYIVADLQFAYYKVPAINETLKSIGMYMEVSQNDGSQVRTICSNSILPMMNSKTIEVITKKSGSIKIENMLRGYEYNLQEAE